jgi:hypothetical protein
VAPSAEVMAGNTGFHAEEAGFTHAPSEIPVSHNGACFLCRKLNTIFENLLWLFPTGRRRLAP